MMNEVDANDTVGSMKTELMRGSLDKIRGEKANKEMLAKWGQYTLKSVGIFCSMGKAS